MYKKHENPAWKLCLLKLHPLDKTIYSHRHDFYVYYSEELKSGLLSGFSPKGFV
jgi:hypothetical protein